MDFTIAFNALSASSHTNLLSWEAFSSSCNSCATTLKSKHINHNSKQNPHENNKIKMQISYESKNKKSPVLTKLSNALLAESSDWSPKTLKISDEAMIDVLHKALLGFFIAFTTINITFSL
jgi:hypothetical protein